MLGYYDILITESSHRSEVRLLHPTGKVVSVPISVWLSFTFVSHFTNTNNSVILWLPRNCLMKDSHVWRKFMLINFNIVQTWEPCTSSAFFSNFSACLEVARLKSRDSMSPHPLVSVIALIDLCPKGREREEEGGQKRNQESEELQGSQVCTILNLKYWTRNSSKHVMVSTNNFLVITVSHCCQC